MLERLRWVDTRSSVILARWIWFFLSLASLALILHFSVQRVLLLPRPGFDISRDRIVTYIEADTPAAASELKIGDVLTHVDGKPVFPSELKSHDVYQPLYEGKRPGDSVSYTVLREGQALEIDIVTAKLTVGEIAGRTRLPFIALMFWIVGAVLLFLSSERMVQITVFSTCSQLFGLALAAGYASQWYIRGAPETLFIAECLLAATLVHLFIVFPVQKAVPGRTLVLGFIYGAAMLLVVPSLLPRAWRYSLKVLNDMRLVVAPRFLILGALVGLGLLWHTYVVSSSRVVRARIRLVVFGTAVAFGPSLCFSLIPAAAIGSPLVDYETSFLALVIFPLSCAYAVYKYNLMEMDLVINRSTVLLLLALLSVSSYLLLMAVVGRLFPTFYALRPYSGALVALLTVLPMALAQRRIQVFVNRIFYGSWYDYSSIISAFSRDLARILDMATLVHLLVQRLTDAMKVKRTAFLSLEGQHLVVKGSVGLEGAERSFVIHAEGRLASCLKESIDPLEAQLLRSKLGAESQENVPDWSRLWVPIILGRELRGVLILGDRLADDVYSQEDVQILGTLARQVAVAVHNVYLVETLRQSLEEKRVLYHRLVGVREEERKRLAWDLHDQVIQDLSFLSSKVAEFLNAPLAHSSLIKELETLRKELKKSISDLRQICTDLRPKVLDLGLPVAIKACVNDFRRKATLPVDLSIEGFEEEDVSEEVCLAIYRIAQEALNNVQKHARAQQVKVWLNFNSDNVEMSIADDGCGFSLPTSWAKLTEQGHFGLAFLHERAQMIGGNLSIEAVPDQGTTIRVKAPLRRVLNST
jgi:signal transduction histidine kinase